MKETLRRMQEKRANEDRGFTLIELLVVVVIIGVLVAIAIPVYMNYQKGAADKAAQSDVRNAITAVENFYTTNGNAYPASAAFENQKLTLTGGGSTTQDLTASEGVTMNYVLVEGTNAPDTYRLCAVNAEGGSGVEYQYDSALGGSVEQKDVDMTTCAPAGAGAGN
ncbi:prepilin-type N-terminal cleavage/methylation domain-containing protein [Planomonospora sp. ID82291]|uniref:prepilin-type N-terminal cleavage/methylation domain-containing protein n=1 Tax=Planomonospora sp. ID82291 TaxID=2738136 RepID=UPI001A231DDA|nr:prepilin-type N-terminal cleavage/methylation domain-containing protein [Planomonospora sp. ID82291]MBG0813114.1 prepilin-type N-terminal cleavage/methylation domain-containing protein [Planomonospora sp. ID82291]